MKEMCLSKVAYTLSSVSSLCCRENRGEDINKGGNLEMD